MTKAELSKRPLVAKILMAKIAACICVSALSVSACAIDRTTSSLVADVQAPTTGTVQTEPTSAPPPPTAASVPTPTIVVEPTPTDGSTPTPVQTATPAGPPPLATRTADDELLAEMVQPGLVRIPVGVTSFVLATPRPILQLSSHTLIYVDSEQQAEVDIFTPYASAAGDVFADYDAVIDHLSTNDAFVGISELPAVSIAGFPARVFSGTGVLPSERAFFTDKFSLNSDLFGWFTPLRIQMWVIDHPQGTIIVSAESLEDPGQFSDAIRLATEILSTIDFE